MRAFLVALQFLTRLPINFSRPATDKEVGQSIIFYPLVGLLIGGVLVLAAWGLKDAPFLLAAALVLTVWVLASGGLHLDGLADSADAWVGGFGDRQRTLDIMKDPYCGPVAVMVIVLMLILKFAAIYALLDSSNYLLLLIPPLLGRASLPLLFVTTEYVRKGGLGEQLAKHCPKPASVIVVVISLVITMGLLMRSALFVIPVFVISFYLIRLFMLKRIGGTTGDTAGAMLELMETIVIITMALAI